MATLLLARKPNPIGEFGDWLTQQQFFVLIGISLRFSVFVALMITHPILFSLMPLPLITLLYTLLEMRTAAFEQSTVFMWSVIITGFGLGLGEAIDLWLAPSMRY